MHFPVTLTQSHRSGSKNELLKITSKQNFPAFVHREKKRKTPNSSSELLIHSNKKTTAK